MHSIGVGCDVVQNLCPVLAREDLIHSEEGVVYGIEGDPDVFLLVVLLWDLTTEQLRGKDGHQKGDQEDKQHQVTDTRNIAQNELDELPRLFHSSQQHLHDSRAIVEGVLVPVGPAESKDFGQGEVARRSTEFFALKEGLDLLKAFDVFSDIEIFLDDSNEHVD